MARHRGSAPPPPQPPSNRSAGVAARALSESLHEPDAAVLAAEPVRALCQVLAARLALVDHGYSVASCHGLGVLTEPEVSQDREHHDHDTNDVKDVGHTLPPFHLPSL